MSPVTRRILLYWLLLLVPTCAVGVGAIQLLRREQARIAEQEGYASEARRAAVTARAGLIVENVELLAGDVQAGLLDGLAALPARDLDAELTGWSRANPLVRVAFRARSDGAVLHVAAAGDSGEVAGFRRRAAAAWTPVPPWRTPARAEEESVSKATFSAGSATTAANKDELTARLQATANVSKLQSARRDAQSAARARSMDYAAPAAAAPRVVAEEKDSDATEAAPRVLQRGWMPWSHEGRLHVFGWVERTDGVLGVELELAALIARLGAALPGETGASEGFALLDERGRVMHQVGFVPRDQLGLAEIPVANEALRDWKVVAYVDAPLGQRSTGAGFFVLGSVLVGILLVAILAGGSLLFWQARRSAAEAAHKTSFVANVSHEFKTPLTTIRLYAELLENGRVADPERRADYLRTIGRETQRLARLVGNVLDFSRLEQGRKKFVREALDLRGELARLIETQQPRFAEFGLVLRPELPDGEVEIATDRDAVGQIVLNLIDNAAKYGAAGGEVVVRLASGVGLAGVRIEVLDRGPGVPAAHRERIFEKFHRVDDALTAEHAGAGLGLSIARQLARGLGGELRHAPREGGGAVFILELP